MHKIIQEIMSPDYPGLVRTIEVFDNIIGIEFNFQYSNEIGIRFYKSIIDARQENISLKEYYTTKSEFSDPVIDDITIRNSWLRLLSDTINGKVALPGNGEGYVYQGDKNELIQSLHYYTADWGKR